MIGIVLASHGKFAEGMKDAAEMLFGPLKQVTCVSLEPGQAAEDFQKRLSEAIHEVDEGNGAIILCDVLGGTPSNRAAFLMSKVDVIAGVNLSLLLELLGQRLCDEVNIATLMDVGKQGLAHMNPLFGM